MKRLAATALLLVGMVGLGSLFTAHAQFAGSEPLSLLVTPNYPRPYQTVTVVPQSSAIDLTASTVTISANGVVAAQGSGAEPAYITVGGPGSVTTVTMRAVYGGQTYTKTVTLRPADVALILEPTSTSHPFYEGGALVASEGRVRLIALPDLRRSSGAVIPASELVYTWRNGEQILQGSSGIGKSVLTATAPVRYRDAVISVTVATQDQSIVAQASTALSPVEPLVRIYRTDPLLGSLFATALPRSVTMRGAEESYRAVPYHFPAAPLVSWEVNNAPGGNDKNITVRASGNGAGTALLSVSAKTPNTSQTASAAVSVTFGEERAFNIFGF